MMFRRVVRPSDVDGRLRYHCAVEHPEPFQLWIIRDPNLQHKAWFAYRTPDADHIGGIFLESGMRRSPFGSKEMAALAALEAWSGRRI